MLANKSLTLNSKWPLERGLKNYYYYYEGVR